MHRDTDLLERRSSRGKIKILSKVSHQPIIDKNNSKEKLFQRLNRIKYRYG